MCGLAAGETGVVGAVEEGWVHAVGTEPSDEAPVVLLASGTDPSAEATGVVGEEAKTVGGLPGCSRVPAEAASGETGGGSVPPERPPQAGGH